MIKRLATYPVAVLGISCGLAHPLPKRATSFRQRRSAGVIPLVDIVGSVLRLSVTKILHPRKRSVTTRRDTRRTTNSEDANNDRHRRRWSLCRTIHPLGCPPPRFPAQKVKISQQGPESGPESR